MVSTICSLVAPKQRGLKHIPNRQRIGERRLLPHIPDASPLAHRNIARIRILFTRQNLQQRRLARTIRSNQTNPVTIRDNRRNIPKQSIRAKGL